MAFGLIFKTGRLVSFNGSRTDSDRDQIRVVKWLKIQLCYLRNCDPPFRIKFAISQIAKVAKIARSQLRLLRKLRIFIFANFLINQLELGQNDRRQDASQFSFGPRRILSGSLLPKYEI